MDPCPFTRLTIGNLALTLSPPSKPPRNVIHPTTPSSPPPPQCFIKIKLKGFPTKTATITPNSQSPIAAVFHLSRDDLEKIRRRRRVLKISVFSGREKGVCVTGRARLLGRIAVSLEGLSCVSDLKGVVLSNGWSFIGKHRVHVCIRVDPDPRFVFQFDGEPECSPLVFQTCGVVNQPVFTCDFGFRNAFLGDRVQQTRSLKSEQGSGRGWLTSLGSERERERPLKERKGWSITIHDLSGSPVAAASMVTPFVASPGSDIVSRSNPGSWLILRPGNNTWKPWGRLEAWRERGAIDGIGYKFEVIPDMSSTSRGVVLAEAILSSSKGGKFVIDEPERGFVMSAKVEGEGKGKCSKPIVEVGVRHVNCMEDVAGFVALAAAVDLSIDACRAFSHKLRKELCQNLDLGC